MTAINTPQKRRRREVMLPGGRHWLFLTPVLIVMLLTAVIPVIFTFALSLTTSETGKYLNRDFSGFDQYARAATDPQFWSALTIQLVFVSFSVALQIGLGLLIALALTRDTRLSRAMRGPLLAPAVLPTIIVALVFKFLLHSQLGAISYYLRPFGIDQAWLDNGTTALIVIILVDVWQFTPITALLLLAGIQSIPKDYLEAATLDGAGPVKRTLWVTIPLLGPVLVTVAVLRIIDAVQVFPTIYILTSGGPGTATTVLNFFGFSTFFVKGDVAYGTTIAILLTFISVVIAITVSLVNRRKLQLHLRG